MIVFLVLLATAFAGWRAWRRLSYFLHVFQLEGYKINEYKAWIRARRGRLIFRTSHAIGLSLLAAALLFFWMGAGRWLAGLLLFLWAVAFASSRIYRRERQKKPIAYTPRLQRLLTTAAVLTVLPVSIGLGLWISLGAPIGVLFFLAGFWAADFYAPRTVTLAARLMRPVEARIQEGFKEEARQSLGLRRDLKIVGITGSYGKTSTKFVVAELLRQRHNVLATPSSYNTPMGVCIVVNNQLQPEHQVLVLEMGMRYPGDIAELCDLARPDIAVVTSVGVAHLETMGTIDAIAHEKAEIIRHMKRGGMAVLNADDERVAAMAELASGRVWRVSVEGNEADITAHDIRYGPDGSSFVVRDDEGEEASFTTPLLGKHNVLNVLLGVAVGRAMGLSLRQLAHAAKRIEPVEHRLQLKQEGPITVIDDAFNSNPVGARNAVEILGQFDTGRRIIVTPGMVELGERQEEENQRFGAAMADHVDLAILVGPRQTEPIRRGLQSRGFPDDQIQTVDSLFEARSFLKKFARPGDVVLYENDLPDQYDEA